MESVNPSESSISSKHSVGQSVYIHSLHLSEGKWGDVRGQVSGITPPRPHTHTHSHIRKRGGAERDCGKVPPVCRTEEQQEGKKKDV